MRSLPPVAAAIGFVDCINRADLDGSRELMTDDHVLRVFDEPPVLGRGSNLEAWRGYIARFPNYVIYPHRIADSEWTVALLGHTTGSRLGFADDEESRFTLIWLAEVADGAVSSWSLIDDTPVNRRRTGLDRPLG